MKANEAKLYIESLITKDSKKSDLKIYNKFINILDYIEAKGFDTNETDLIENKLAELNLTAEKKNKKVHIFKACNSFVAFLKKEFSLIVEGHYMALGTGLGIALGMSLGVSFGVIFSRENGAAYGMLYGMPIGLAIGSVIGSIKDKEAKKKNLVIPNTLL